MRILALAVFTVGVVAAGIAFAQNAGTVIVEHAPTDHTIAIPKEKLAAYFKDMDAKKLTSRGGQEFDIKLIDTVRSRNSSTS